MKKLLITILSIPLLASCVAADGSSIGKQTFNGSCYSEEEGMQIPYDAYFGNTFDINDGGWVTYIKVNTNEKLTRKLPSDTVCKTQKNY